MQKQGNQGLAGTSPKGEKSLTLFRCFLSTINSFLNPLSREHSQTSILSFPERFHSGNADLPSGSEGVSKLIPKIGTEFIHHGRIVESKIPHCGDSPTPNLVGILLTRQTINFPQLLSSLINKLSLTGGKKSYLFSIVFTIFVQ